MKYLTYLLLALLIIGCTTYQSYTGGKTIGELTTQEELYSEPYDEVYNATQHALAYYNFEITHSDRQAGIIQADGYIDKYSITISENSDSTKVHVQNDSWADNARADVTNFLDNIGEYLNTGSIQ